MKIVGLTGGIGSGKSIVSRILRIKGYLVYDCDHEAKLLSDKSLELKDFLHQYGNSYITHEGAINRKALAKLIFNNKEALANVNKIVHNLVRVHIKEWLEFNAHTNILFIESAILYSSSLHLMTNYVCRIKAPENLCIQRVMTRNNLSIDSILERINNQKNEIYFTAPDFIITNDNNHSLLQQIDKLIIDIKSC